MKKKRKKGMRFRKRLSAVILAAAMLLTSAQLPGGVSYAAQLSDGAEMAGGGQNQPDNGTVTDGVSQKEGEEPATDNRTGEDTPADSSQTGDDAPTGDDQAGEDTPAGSDQAGEDTSAGGDQTGDDTPADSGQAGEDTPTGGDQTGEDAPAGGDQTGEDTSAGGDQTGEDAPAGGDQPEEDTPADGGQTGDGTGAGEKTDAGQISGNDLEEPTLDAVARNAADAEETIEFTIDGAYQFGDSPVKGQTAKSSDADELAALTASGYEDGLETYLYEQMKKYQAAIDISSYNVTSASVLSSVISGVLNEHPDLYYVNKQWNLTQSGGKITSVSCTYKSGYSDDAFEEAVWDALACVEDGMSDYAKATALHDYLAVNIAYDYDNYKNNTIPDNSYNAYGALVDGTAVCQGYALAYKYLLKEAGIDCYMVTSKTMNHAWNMVKIDGKYYHVDVTWDDPTRDMTGRARHVYLFRSDANFDGAAVSSSTHKDWTVTDGSQTVNYQATDTTYEDAFWVDSKAPLVFDGNICYYITTANSQNSLRKADFSKLSDAGTEVVKIGYWPSGSGYWQGAFSGLYRIGSRLYYNDATSIYSINPDGTDQKTAFTLSDTSGGYIYGSVYRGGKVYYCLRQSPNLTEGNETVLTAELETGDGGSEDPEPDPGEVVDSPIPPGDDETAEGYNIDSPVVKYGKDFWGDITTTIRDYDDFSCRVLIFSMDFDLQTDAARTLYADIRRNHDYFTGGKVNLMTVALDAPRATSDAEYFSYRDYVNPFSSDIYGYAPVRFSSTMVKASGDDLSTRTAGLRAYTEAIGKVDTSVQSTKDLPLVVYIDKNNKIQYAERKKTDAFQILKNLRKYCGYTDVYAIKYELGGGANHYSNPHSYGADGVESFNDPLVAKEGCQFAGWYLDRAYTKKITKIPAGTKADITLYAKWTEQSGQNDALNMENPEKTFTAADGTKLSTTADGKPKLLVYYGTQSKAGEEALDAIQAALEKDPNHVLSGIDVYAVWNAKRGAWNYPADAEEKAKEYQARWSHLKVVYDKEEGDDTDDAPYWQMAGYESGHVGLDTYAVLTPSICYIDAQNRLQYVTIGGYGLLTTDTDYLVTPTVDGILRNLQLYCKYPNAGYTITYMLDGGTNDAGNPSSYTAESETITLKAASREGFTFDGWYKDAAFAERVTEIAKGSTGDITLYAKWQRQGSAGDGLNLANLEYSFTTIADQTVTSKAGGKPKILFYFKTECFNCQQTNKSLKQHIGIFEGADIYAVEIGKSEKSAVSDFKGQYGCDEITYCYDTGATNNASMWAYLKQVGITGSAATPAIVYIDANNRLQKVTTGRKAWSEVLEDLRQSCGYDYYTITYELDGGTNDSANPDMYQSSKGTALKDASKPAYTFEGWYTDAAFAERVTEIAKGTTGNLTLYAKWKEQETAGNGLNLDNLEDTYQTIYDQTVTSKANGKPRVLFFFSTGCGNCRYTNQEIKEHIQIFADADIYALEINSQTKDAVYTFKTAYGCDEITYCYGGVNSASMWDYLGKAKIPASTVTTPVIVYIDANNRLQRVTTGRKSWTQVLVDLQESCGYEYYMVNYELDGGTNDSANPDIYQSSKGAALKDASKAGHVFEGWYTDAAFTEKLTQIAKGTTGNLTLYAKWGHNASGLGLANLDQTYSGIDQKKYSSKADGKPKLLVFFGEKHTASQNTVKNITEIIGSLDGVDVYAINTTQASSPNIGNTNTKQFKQDYGCDNITFAYDDWTAPVNLNKAQAYHDAAGLSGMYLPIMAFIDEDNKLQWVSDHEQTGEQILENLRKYCKYSPNGVYRITYELDGGINSADNPEEYTAETETITLRAASKEGFVFGGWYTDAQFTQKVEQIVKGSTGDITLYAKWIPQGSNEAEIEITFLDKAFVYNGAEQEPGVKVTAKDADGKVITLKEEKDYELSYQNNKNAGMATVTVKGIGEYTGEVSENFRIEPAPLVIRAMDLMMLVGDSIPEQYKYEIDGLCGTDELIKEPVLSCEITSTETEGEYVVIPSGADAGNNYAITYENGVLRVVRERNTCKVVFDVQGRGSVPAAYVGIPCGSTIDSPEEPTAEGYRFDGWYKDTACTLAWDFENDTVQADLTLYAKWLGVDSDGEFAVQEIADLSYNGKAQKPAVGVYDEDKLLKAGKDYTIKYYNNTNANAEGMLKGETFNEKLPYVAITGKGNYKETVKINFNILPASIGVGYTPAAGVTLKVNDHLVKATKAQKPFGSIKFGRSMKADVDYELKLEPMIARDASGKLVFDSLRNAQVPAGYTGEFVLTVTGVGNYTGSISRNVYVADKTHLMKNVKITLGTDVKNMAYTGSKITLKAAEKRKPASDEFVVTYGRTVLRPNVDYSVAYQNNTDVGKAELTVIGRGAYVGRKTANFNIKGKTLTNGTVTVTGLEDRVYTGRAVVQNQNAILTWKADGTKLEYGTDYRVSYSKNIKKGTATITFTGKAEAGYSGKISKKFKIGAADISKVTKDESMQAISLPYTKAGVKPVEEIVLTNGEGTRLRYGKDYTLTYKNNKAVANAGAEKAPTVTVKGKGNYSGSFDVKFTIVQADLGGGNITIECAQVAYNSKKPDTYVYKPAVKVKDGKTTLKAGKDYEITYEKNTQADCRNYIQNLIDNQLVVPPMEGRAMAVITAKEGGAYSQQEPIQVPLQIYMTKLTKSNLEVKIDSAVYTGGQVKPKVTVACKVEGGSIPLTEGVDYTLVYGANIASGKNKGSVTVKGLAPDYGGSVTYKFEIGKKDLKYWGWPATGDEK